MFNLANKISEQYYKYIQGTKGNIGEGNGNPLQYSCLENPMDKGAWQAPVHRGCKSWA